MKVVDECIAEYADAYIDDTNKVYNNAFMNYVELGNVLIIARAVCMGALERKESRGSHSRADYPTRDDARFMKHSLVSLAKDGSFSLDWRDVTVTSYQPQERKY